MTQRQSDGQDSLVGHDGRGRDGACQSVRMPGLRLAVGLRGFECDRHRHLAAIEAGARRRWRRPS